MVTLICSTAAAIESACKLVLWLPLIISCSEPLKSLAPLSKYWQVSDTLVSTEFIEVVMTFTDSPTLSNSSLRCVSTLVKWVKSPLASLLRTEDISLSVLTRLRLVPMSKIDTNSATKILKPSTIISALSLTALLLLFAASSCSLKC